MASEARIRPCIQRNKKTIIKKNLLWLIHNDDCKKTNEEIKKIMLNCIDFECIQPILKIEKYLIDSNDSNVVVVFL